MTDRRRWGVGALCVAALLGWIAYVSDPASDAEPDRRGALEAPDGVLPVRAPEAAEPARIDSQVAPARERSAGRELVLEVTASDGSALSDATVVVRQGPRTSHGPTDAEGRVSFHAMEGRVDVLVLTGTALRLETSLDDGEGHHRVSLVAGRGLAGVVRVDGRSPVRRASVRVRSESAANGCREPEPELAAALGWRGLQGRPEFWVRTGADGSFRVDDLPAGWRGELLPEHGYSLEDGSESIAVAAPAEGLVVALRALPAIVGQVLAGSTGEPAAGARCTYSLECRAGGSQGAVDTDERGEFRIPLACLPAERATITVLDANLGKAIVRIPAVGPSGVDVGKVWLEQTLDVWLRVTDETGTPLAGAEARLDDASPESERTDARGMLLLRALPAEADVLVEALGHAPARLQVLVATSEEAPLAVPLAPLPALELRARGVDGSIPEGLIVELESADRLPFCIGGRAEPRAVQTELGAAAPTLVTSAGSGPDAALLLSYPLGPSGELRIVGLCPDRPLIVRLQDASKGTIEEHPVRPEDLLLGAHVEFLVPDGDELVLRVVDGDGSPVPGASVGRRDGNRRLAKTDADGTARIGPVFASELDLFVTKRGYAAALIRAPLGSSSPLEVVLRPPAAVRLVVAASDGSRLRPDDVICKLGEYSVGVPSASGDELEIRELPQQPFRLFVRVGGRWFESLHDPSEAEARIETPTPGSLAVTLSASAAAAGPRFLRLRSLLDADVALERAVSSGAGTEFAVLFPDEYAVELFDGPDATDHLLRHGVIRVDAGVRSALEL